MNSDASSVESTCQFFCVPSVLTAAVPASIESCRNPAVLEKTSARSFAFASSAASTWTGMSRVAVPPLPSDTVSFTVLLPAVVNVVFAVAPVASAVPLPSKSHEYVSASPLASVAAAFKRHRQRREARRRASPWRS